MSDKSLIITSIAADTLEVLHTFAKECTKRNFNFILIGDTKSPDKFEINGCDYWSVERQLTLNSKFAKLCPTKHYARKNIGYIIALQNGTQEIVETDDDNLPRAEFWNEKSSNVSAYDIKEQGWVNVYNYFSDKFIWHTG